jgi:hypothetical protein
MLAKQEEHSIQDIKGTFTQSDANSRYSNHILSMGHTYGTITDIMDVIKMGRKGRHLNTLERYHIYKLAGTTYT